VLYRVLFYSLHIHLHFLVTEGGEDSELMIHHVASLLDSLLAQLFKREVFALLLGKELISEALVERIEGWRHSGFSVHGKIWAKIRQEAERLEKYMRRPLLSLERLSFEEKEGKVCYRYGKTAEEVERMDYLEFIARLTSNISPRLSCGGQDQQPSQSDVCRRETAPRISPTRSFFWSLGPRPNIFHDFLLSQGDRSG